MKLTAVFSSADSADAALAHLRAAGIELHRPHTRPLTPPMTDAPEHFMLFPSAYEAGSMLFPYEMPHLNPCVLRSPLSAPARETQTLLTAYLAPGDAARSGDILRNAHASGVRFG